MIEMLKIFLKINIKHILNIIMRNDNIYIYIYIYILNGL